MGVRDRLGVNGCGPILGTLGQHRPLSLGFRDRLVGGPHRSPEALEHPRDAPSESVGVELERVGVPSGLTDPTRGGHTPV